MISRDGDKMSGWWGERTNLGKGETQPNSLRVFYNSISHYNITVTSAKSVNLYFYPQDSLRSRWLEVVGTKKNARERRRHARREGVPARKAPENCFPLPLQLPGSHCVICQKFWQKTTDLAQTKRAAKKRCTFYLRSKYICYKDQLGSLIIERWSNKLMVNTQL